MTDEMGSADYISNDFLQAMGEEFSTAVSPPVAFEDASPHDCCNAIQQAFGADVTPARLASFGETELQRLATAFGDWFEVPPPETAKLRTAVGGILARWPAT